MENPPVLSVDITKTVTRDMSLEARFEIFHSASPVVVVFGPSGSGKTTLIRCLAGLEKVDHGRISFQGATWIDTEAGVFLAPQRRRVGYVPQDYALFPHLTVRENIEYGLTSGGKQPDRDFVARLLHTLGLVDFLSESPAVLSGGERQKVALARALARRPRLLLLDEPLSALDLPTRQRLRLELARILTDLGVPCVLVTHDWEEALSLSQHMLVMREGRVLQCGAPLEVLTRPVDVGVAAIVGIDTVVPGRIVERSSGLAAIDVSGRILWAADVPIDQEEVYVCLRAEDFTIELGHGTRTSARNHLAGTVARIVSPGPLVRLIVDVGFEAAVVITRQALEDLGVSEGSTVTLAVKATAVHLIPRCREGEA